MHNRTSPAHITIGDLKKTGIRKERNYDECYKWAVLCVDNPEYSPESFIAMAILSELYANGLGCSENHRHAVLLRTIADLYDSAVDYELEYVSRSFHISPELENWAKPLAMAYFGSLKHENIKPMIALPSCENADTSYGEFKSTVPIADIGGVNNSNQFPSEQTGNPEYISDDTLIEVSQLIVTALDLQIRNAQSMSTSIPGNGDSFKALLSSAFFYGYVIGLCGKIAAERFDAHIDNHNLGKNIRRLVQAVIANLFYSDSEPDWNAIQTWEAQSAAFGMAHNDDYQRGVNAGVLLGEEILTSSNTSSITLLGAELLKPM